jgi:hypothetical protein
LATYLHESWQTIAEYFYTMYPNTGESLLEI